MAYVIPSYLVLNGYLRDIGTHIPQFQRSINEMEELVQPHEEALGMADHADARPIRIKTDEIRFEDVTFRYAGQDKSLFEHLDVTVPPASGGVRILARPQLRRSER